MEIPLTYNSGTPLYQQIVESITWYISVGHVKDGDRLPPARHLAEDLGVHYQTVARAYRELDAAGLASARPALGTYVAANPEAIDLSRRAAAALRALLGLIKQYKRISLLAPSRPRDTLFTLWQREMTQLLADFSTLLADIAAPAPFPRNETHATTAALYAADNGLPLTQRHLQILEKFGYLDRHPELRERVLPELPKTSNNAPYVVPISVGPSPSQLDKTSNNAPHVVPTSVCAPHPSPAQLDKTSNNDLSVAPPSGSRPLPPAQLDKTSNNETPPPTSPRPLSRGYRPKKSKHRRR